MEDQSILSDEEAESLMAWFFNTEAFDKLIKALCEGQKI